MVQLTRLSMANRALVSLICLAIVGFGLVSTTSLKQELVPSLTLPGASVVTSYAGATPQTIERDVTKPIEDAVKGVAGVTKVTSVSAANVSQVQVEWNYGEDTSQMEAKVRSQIEQMKSTLPENTTPRVVVGSFDDLPIIMLAVTSTKDPSQLASDLRDIAIPRLSALKGVRAANVTGEQARQVTITARQADLDRLGVDLSQLTQILPAYKMQVPAGEISNEGRTINIQVGQTLTSVDAVADLRLQGKDNPVALRDVADVAEVPVDTTSISRVNGKPALSLMVTKTSDANTVTVAHAVKDALPAVQRQIGGSTNFRTIFDQAPFIEQSIHDLAVEGGLGLVMAVLVILAFLWSVRATIITAISIPLSLLIAMIGLYSGGFTLNLLTLSALTIAVGRVVDDSIVVIENIERHKELGGEFGVPTIITSVREVAGAITASTITTVAVFAPIALVGGQTGELFRPFALTVTMALLASLVVALTIVPVLAYWFMKPGRRAREAKAAAAPETDDLRASEASRGAAAREQKLESHESRETWLQKAYLPFLRASLKHPIVTLLVAVLVFGATMAGATTLKTDFIGSMGQNTLQLSQKLPAGTSLAETDRAAQKVEAVLAANPAVETYQSSIGGGGIRESFGGGTSGANEASYSVTLKDGSETTAVQDQLKAEFAKLTDAGKVDFSSGGGVGGSSTLDVTIQGQDEGDLAKAAEEVIGLMNRTPGLTGAKSNLSEQQSVLQVNVRPADAARLGMNQGTIGQAATQAIKGQKLGTVTIDRRTQDLVLRSRSAKTKAELENLPLPVSQKQDADAKKAISDELQADQDRKTDEQLEKATEQIDEQEEKTQKSRDDLRTQLDKLDEQIAQADSAAAAPAPTMPANPVEAQRAQVAAAQAQAAAQAAAKKAQAEQLREQRTKLSEQITEIDKSLDKIAEQRADQAKSRREAAEAKAKSEAAKNAKGRPVALKDVADVVEVQTPSSVRRTDGVRTVTVSAVPDPGALGTVTESLTTGLDRLTLPSGTVALIGGVSADQQEAFAQLGLAMLVAIAIVYMVMVAQFKSLVQPLILLVSVPFAATGAVGALLLTDTALGIPSMIGLLMLIGIVVTNAIVLIDLVNKYRNEGASIDDALIHGARLRLRPIVMTALATVMALVPMALGLTGGGVFISQSLAIVVIGGLLSSTLLTLILVPVLYRLIEKVRERAGTRPAPRAGEGDGDDAGLAVLGG
ncbi:efflux RND transporter permease subunit [Mariniluteicoccus flavus]